MHVSYGPDMDSAQDASLEKLGDYDIELTTRSQELGGAVVKPLARGGMAQVKGSVAKSSVGGLGKELTKALPGGKSGI